MGQFYFFMDFRRTLIEQEKPAKKQDDRLPANPYRKPFGINIVKGVAQADEKRNGKKQDNTLHHGQQKTNIGGFFLLFFWQFVSSNGDKNNVVYTQDNFKEGKGK